MAKKKTNRKRLSGAFGKGPRRWSALRLKSGAFTLQARRAGYSNNLRFAKHVLRTVKRKGTGTKGSFSETTRKRAQFVVNASKWRKG